MEVVKTLKELPMHVRLVCARHPHPVFPEQSDGDIAEEGQESNLEVSQGPEDEGTISFSAEGVLESAAPQVFDLINVLPCITTCQAYTIYNCVQWPKHIFQRLRLIIMWSPFYISVFGCFS